MSDQRSATIFAASPRDISDYKGARTTVSTDQRQKDKQQGQSGHRCATALKERMAAAWAGVTLTVVLVLAGTAPTAQAAGFVPVSICRTADGMPVVSPDVVFRNSDSVGVTADIAEDRCASGGALELAMNAGAQHQGTVSLEVDAPGDGTRLESNFQSVTMWRSVVVDATKDPQTGRTPQVSYQLQTGRGTESGFESCGPFTCSTLGSEAATPLSEANRFVVTSQAAGVPYLSLAATCAATNQNQSQLIPCPPVGGPRIRVRVYRISLQAVDVRPPTFEAAPSGALVTAGATVKGTQAVTYSASDPSGEKLGAGGVWKGEVLVDGQPLASQIADSNGGVCKELSDGSFASARPCKTTVAGAVVALDTLKLANGAHTVAVRVTDAAGNQTTSSTNSVTVANPATNTAQPTLGAAGTGGAWAPRRRATRSVRRLGSGVRMEWSSSGSGCAATRKATPASRSPARPQRRTS